MRSGLVLVVMMLVGGDLGDDGEEAEDDSNCNGGDEVGSDDYVDGSGGDDVSWWTDGGDVDCNDGGDDNGSA